MTEPYTRIAICGAGAMGSAIAQTAAQAGAEVGIYDASATALAAGRSRTLASINSLVERGRLAAAEAAAISGRIRWVAGVNELAGAELAIEAVVEDASVKTALFAELEGVLGPAAVLATNTSSLAIGRLARPFAQPARFVGMHFFNPATVMKLVEIIPGPLTDPDILARVAATARAWGKIPIEVADVPGFIVNRVARPYYAEAFAALTEAAASADRIDALFRGAGFRMGPLELTDLIGQDVNFAVARSIHEAYFGCTRFMPQLAQAALVQAGHLGCKTGRGVYAYPAPKRETLPPRLAEPSAAHRDAAQALSRSIATPVLCDGIDVGLTTGKSARMASEERGRPAARLDWFATEEGAAGAIGFAASSAAAAAAATGVIAALGRPALQIADRPGLIVARTLGQIANAAADAVLEKVADEAGIDTALRFGVNYPFGPFAWADRFGRGALVGLLDAISAETGLAMYRPSFHLRRTV